MLIGHSMGGALTQWYLKYGRSLPAAVLVAPWPSHAMRKYDFQREHYPIQPVAGSIDDRALRNAVFSIAEGSGASERAL